MEFGKTFGKNLIGKRQLMQFEIIYYFYNHILLKYFSLRHDLKFDLNEELIRRMAVQGGPTKSVTFRMARALKWMGTLNAIQNDSTNSTRRKQRDESVLFTDFCQKS